MEAPQKTVTINASDPLQVIAVKHVDKLSYQQRLLLAHLISALATEAGAGDEESL